METSTTTKPLSRNDKVIHYLHYSIDSSMKTFDRTMYSSSQSSSLLDYDSLSSSSPSSSILDFPLQSDTSLSDPIVYNSSNQSIDEDFDFNLTFEQIDDKQTINTNTTLINIDQPIVDEYFRQNSNNDRNIIQDHLKENSSNYLYDSTYTLYSENTFAEYINDQSSIITTGHSNSFSNLPNDNHSLYIKINTPKKIVRFADMLGLDLESIRYMTPPDQIATSSYQECLRLPLLKNPFEIPNIYKRITCPSPPPSSTTTNQYNLISKNFISPINIIPLIYEKHILLECLYTKNSCAYGTIRVHNLNYNKHVFIRLSYDEWLTSNDIQATHSMNYSHDNTDTYIFEINLTNDNHHCKRILFALCLQINGDEYWDNNHGWNYVLDVFQRR